MTMGKSFNKSILFVLGIILVVSAFSGCTDVDGPDSTFTEAGASDLIGKDINAVHQELKDAGYDMDITNFPETQKIHRLLVYDGNGNELVIKDDDGELKNGKLGIESAVINSDKNPAPTNDKSGIRTAGGYTLDDLFDMAKNDPNKLLGMNINDVQLKGLGEAPGGSGVIENSNYDLAWKNPAPGIEEYVEEYNYKDEIKAIRIIKQQGTGLSIYDLVKNNNEESQDGKIDAILNLVNGKQTITKAE